MNSFQENLYNELMQLCASNDAFYFVDQFYEGKQYRVFTYRLASYNDFLLPSALECRGHTFLVENGNFVELVSFAMQKFFNLGENPMTMNLDVGRIDKIMDKLDGSLISTVKTPTGFTLKSKTSFSSSQAQEARELLNSEEYRLMYLTIVCMVADNFTVNMEYCSPTNTIVLGYDKPILRVLNVRNNLTGEYVDESYFFTNPDYLVNSLMVPADKESFIKSIDDMTGIEGFVIRLDDGTLFKVKCNWYQVLHKTKDSINCARKLWETCLNEAGDDLRALFKDDPTSVQKILDMEQKAATIFNSIHKQVHVFYDNNKHLDRKSYAIKGQKELSKDGTFSLAMNLYIGRDANVKEFLIKHYKDYGVSDVEEPVDE